MKKTALLLTLSFASFCAFATMEAAWNEDENKPSVSHVSCPQFVYIQTADGKYQELTWAHQIKKRNFNIDNGECVYR